MAGTSVKEPLKREELRDVIDVSLWAGQMLLQTGAESQRVEETVHRLGTGLGCDWMDILVSPNVLIVTTISGIEFRTKVRRVVGMRVDMSVITAINDISHRVTEGTMDRFAVRTELEWLDKTNSHYNRWLVIVMVGLACASFSRLFGGDVPTFFVTFVAASAAMFTRQSLTHNFFNPYLVIVTTAFVGGVIASMARVLGVLDDPSTALAASVLLLVPGVPLINAAQDLIKGHNVTGITRALLGGLISMAIALGLLMAIEITGVTGL
jgi:uncharacterized membrane protein YjjP (DUF1212 family)